MVDAYSRRTVAPERPVFRVLPEPCEELYELLSGSAMTEREHAEMFPVTKLTSNVLGSGEGGTWRPKSQETLLRSWSAYCHY